ncbi:unnamed protein product [Phaedon cochleariae]|uniref:Uncharacterized protein n=1 Tax=Phaedon cochleariae TaxID=80249 RepID=A0A9N9WY82_PHACE|nr:unnamed protein product [Phaedon cochleariae]
MAGDEVHSHDAPNEKVEKTCFHCNKKVENDSKCIKCKYSFHPACLRQAAAKKNAVCAHEVDGKLSVHNMVSSVPTPAKECQVCQAKETEIQLLNMLVEELRSKNRILEENSGLLKEIAELLKGNLDKYENQNEKHATKKGKQSTDNPTTHTTIAKVNKNSEVSNNSKVLVIKTPSTKTSLSELAVTVPNCSDMVPTEAKELNQIISEEEHDSTNNPNKKNKLGNTLSNLQQNMMDNVINLNNDIPQDEIIQASGQAEQNGNEWTNVVGRRKKTIKKRDPKSRPPPIMGSNDTTMGISAAQKYSWLFVSGLEGSTQAQDVLNYLNTINKQNYVCEKLRTKNERYVSSFKIGVPAALKETIMDGKIWPNGVIINLFMNLKSLARQ